jgi:hypothetical protein
MSPLLSDESELRLADMQTTSNRSETMMGVGLCLMGPRLQGHQGLAATTCNCYPAMRPTCIPCLHNRSCGQGVNPLRGIVGVCDTAGSNGTHRAFRAPVLNMVGTYAQAHVPFGRVLNCLPFLNSVQQQLRDRVLLDLRLGRAPAVHTVFSD